MRILGIEYGKKRIGIAISDEEEVLAFPKKVLDNNNKFIDELSVFIKDNSVLKVVIGESKDFQMKDNSIMEDVKKLKSQIENDLKIEVVLHPEFMTSMQAEKMMGGSYFAQPIARTTKRPKKSDSIDASAAAIILQSYLDSNKNE